MRNPKRTASTAAALMIGVGLVAFIPIFWASATDSIRSTVDKRLRRRLRGAVERRLPGRSAAPTWPLRSRALPEAGTVAEVRYTVAEVNGSGTQLARRRSRAAFERHRRPRRARRAQLTDLAEPGTIAVYDQTAKDKGWAIGDTVAGAVPDHRHPAS